MKKCVLCGREIPVLVLMQKDKESVNAYVDWIEHGKHLDQCIECYMLSKTYIPAG